MGDNQYPSDRDRNAISKLSARIAVVASPAQVVMLQGDSSSAWLGDARMIPVRAEEVLPIGDIDGASIVVVEVDPDRPSSMERIDAIKRFDPSVSIIAAMDSADLGLVRKLVKAGVADVVALPLSAEEILQAIISIMEVRSNSQNPDAPLAPLISVVRALGGTGATTLISHLAAELADPDAAKPNVCIIDLDVQYGRICEVLGLSARRTINDLFDAGDRLDESIFNSVIIEDERGIAVVAAPQEIGPVESLEQGSLQNIIRMARSQYDYVLLDLPSNLTNWSLSLISESDRIIMLTEQNVASLRQARRRIDLFKLIGINMRLLSVVLNRADKRLFKTISVSDVKRALGVEVSEVLSAEAPYIENAQDQGVLVWEVRKKSAYAADVARLAESMAAGLQSERTS